MDSDTEVDKYNGEDKANDSAEEEEEAPPPKNYYFSWTRPLFDAKKKQLADDEKLTEQFEHDLREYEYDIKRIDRDEVGAKREELRKMQHEYKVAKEENQKIFDAFEDEFVESPDVLKTEENIVTYEIDDTKPGRCGHTKKTLTLHENLELCVKWKRKGGKYFWGHIIWPSSWMLGKYIEEGLFEKQLLPGKKFIDLGAGCGLLSIVAAVYGADVIAADLEEQIPFLQQNIDRNLGAIEGSGGKVRTAVLKFGDIEAARKLGKQDFIFMGELIYDQELIKPLVETVLELSHDGTVIVACEEKKYLPWEIWEKFSDQLKENFVLSAVHYKVDDPMDEVDFVDFCFYRGRKKKPLTEEEKKAIEEKKAEEEKKAKEAVQKASAEKKKPY